MRHAPRPHRKLLRHDDQQQRNAEPDQTLPPTMLFVRGQPGLEDALTNLTRQQDTDAALATRSLVVTAK